MTLVEEGVRGAAGALGILLRRPDALGFFNFSRAGFWRSFAAFFAILPFSLVSVALDAPAEAVARLDAAERWTLEIAVEAATWALGPLGVYVGARVTGTAAHWRDLVIVANWAAILVWAILAAATPLVRLIPPGDEEWDAGAVVGLAAALALFAFYVYFYVLIARTALRTTVWPALVVMLIASGTGGLVYLAKDIIAAWL